MYSIGIELNMLFVIEVGKTQKKSRWDFCCIDAFCKYFIELTHLMMRNLDKILYCNCLHAQNTLKSVKHYLGLMR
jgi:hypothetical protein